MSIVFELKKPTVINGHLHATGTRYAWGGEELPEEWRDNAIIIKNSHSKDQPPKRKPGRPPKDSK